MYNCNNNCNSILWIIVLFILFSNCGGFSIGCGGCDNNNGCGGCCN